MELFSLLAKLTLDKKDYEKAIEEAKGEGSFDIEDPSLGLDKTEFDEGIKEAEDTDVEGPDDPDLGLDKTAFDTTVTEAEATEVDDPEDPDLGLDKTNFDTAVEEAESTEVDDPEDPDLGLDKTDFDTVVDEAESTDVDDPEEPSLGLDTEEFDAGVKDAEENGSMLGEVLNGIFENVKGALVTTGIVAAVTGVVSALKEGVELAKNHGDEIDKQSQKMGISAKAYQEWSYALTLSGASITDLNKGLKTWRTSIGDEKKEANLIEAFEALGISADDAFSQIEKAAAGKGTLDKLLDQVITGLSDYDEGDRGRIMKLLFGNSSTELMALLGQTGEEIHAALQEADDLGLVMTDEEVKNAAAYMDATTRMDQSLSALKESFVSEIIPILTDAANWLANIVSMFNWRTGDKSLADQFNELDQSVASSITSLEEREATAKKLLESISELGDYWTLDDKGKKTWDTLAQELIKLYPELDGVIDTNSKTIKGNTDEITKNIEEWTKLEEQRLLDENLAAKRAAIANQYANALDKEVQAEVKSAEAEGKKTTALSKLYEYFKTGAGKAYGAKIFEGTDGTEFTEEMYRKNEGLIKSLLTESGYRDSTVKAAVDAWSDLEDEADNLRKEAAKMTEEADKASQEYEKYADALAKKLGITTSETDNATLSAQKLKETIDSIPDKKSVTLDVLYNRLMTHAIGSAYIPYDNYPALLHRGEKILTATEARHGTDVDVSNLEDRIVAAIEKGLAEATVNAYMDGTLMTREVSDRIARENAARRYG